MLHTEAVEDTTIQLLKELFSSLVQVCDLKQR